MILDFLIPILRTRFPDRGMRVDPGSDPCVTFPAVHSEVGDVQIYDDGEEVTLVAGHFTHGHFTNYDAVPLEEQERRIAEDVAGFLEKLFADQVVFWGSHKGGGGWRVASPGGEDKTKHDKEYVWSGPRRVS